MADRHVPLPKFWPGDRVDWINGKGKAGIVEDARYSVVEGIVRYDIVLEDGGRYIHVAEYKLTAIDGEVPE